MTDPGILLLSKCAIRRKEEEGVAHVVIRINTIKLTTNIVSQLEMSLLRRLAHLELIQGLDSVI